MKFNFGTGLILFFALWAIGIIYLVTLCSKENIDLVSADYYNKEIAFQSQINKEKNADQLSSPLLITFLKEADAVAVHFPKDSLSMAPSGNIHFFKPDDAALDFNVSINCDSTLEQKIPAEKMKHGLWRAKVDWSCNGKSFYEEKNVYIN